jgi:4-hydroxymandelate oxidase
MLRPRVLTGAAEQDLRTTVLGQEVPFPILLGPTAFQRMADPEGELATARAARSLGALMVLSTISSTRLEDVADIGPHRWFQLYVLKDHDITTNLVKRAHAMGYQAIVLTVDTPLLGRRLRDERNRFDLPDGISLANLEGIPLPETEGSSLAAYFGADHDSSLSWDDLPWLRSLSPLPLVLKGVVTAEDAALAVERGVDGIIVSNHGGRQLDGAPATLDALPEVVEAVGGRIDVLMDGGVRGGSDVLKALALGAKAVLLGRSYLWALAAGGEDGVRRMLESMRDDLKLAMALSGVGSILEIGPSLVAPAPGSTGGGR